MASHSAPDQEFRRTRLLELSQHPDFGNKSALAAALGYKGPAYVRQMIDGERPITEKTVGAIERMRGGKYRNWFARAAITTDAADWPLYPFITPESWALLNDAQRNAVSWEASKVVRLLSAASDDAQSVEPAAPETPSNITQIGDQDHKGGLRKTAKQKARTRLINHREGNK